MSRLALLLSTLCLSAVLQAAPLDLDELLAAAPPAPAERALSAELRAQDALLEQRRAEAGWQLFGNATLGRYEDLEGDRRFDYRGQDLAIGVRHPLLGSLHRRLAQVQSGLGEQERQRLRLALLRGEQQLRLREAYADWWRAGEEQRLCRELAGAAATARDAIEARRSAGWMLPSQADALHSRWRTLQRHCSAQDEMRGLAAEWLGELAGRAIPTASSARAEPLASRPQPLSAWLQALDQHPRLVERGSRLAEAEGQRELPWYALLESSVSLSLDFERRSINSQTGGDWVASLDLSAPFDVFDYGEARRREGEARYQAAEAALEDERLLLRRELAGALARHRQAVQALEERSEQLEVARRRLTELRLRDALEGEEGLLHRQDAALAVYEGALRRVAAWYGLWLAEAQLRLLAGESGVLLGGAREYWAATSEAVGQQPSQEAGVWRQGVYVWDSRALLDPQTRAAELRALREAGMQRLYLGLSAAQVERLDALRPELQALLGQARVVGMEPLLLLGEPDWLRAQHRERLATLLARLAGLPFAGVHLDLEVEQLGWPVPAQRLQDWLDTLALAVRSSPWPVELSSHHRWFAAEPASPCVPCALPALGVYQVSLMIYTADPERSAALAEGIARRWPALRFRLAQSVESQLPAEESLAGHSRAQLSAQSARWRTRLQGAALSGVDWQDWQHYPR